MRDSYGIPVCETFICPHCGTTCQHQKHAVVKDIFRDERIKELYYNKQGNEKIGFNRFCECFAPYEVHVCRCINCGEFSLFIQDELVWPKPCGVPASTYMPEQVKKPYDEAQKVLHDSPWAACILLRIALERLCDHLGGTGPTLYKRIESLNLNASEKVIWTAIRKAGNASAHENAEFLSEYQERDTMNPNIAVTLSKFINLIVESHVASQAVAETIVKMLEGS